MAMIMHKTGDKVKTAGRLTYEGITIPAGSYTIAQMSKDSIGICSLRPLDDWGNLDGRVPGHCGLWLHPDFVDKYFVKNSLGQKVVIKDEFFFKKKNLKGKNCVVVGSLPNSKIAFVELQEHVDGCSADGLGKAGYCILIPKKHLTTVK